MKINANKKESRPVGVKYSEKPSPINIAANMGDSFKGNSYITRIMHSEKEPRNNLGS